MRQKEKGKYAANFCCEDIYCLRPINYGDLFELCLYHLTDHLSLRTNLEIKSLLYEKNRSLREVKLARLFS